jgi:DNA repair protein RadD
VFAFVTVGKKENQNSLAGALLRINCASTVTPPAGLFQTGRLKMKLHWYQEEAVRQTWRWLKEKQGNPCIVLPTGAGKTFVMAQMIADAINQGKRVIMATHASELLSQLEEKLIGFGLGPRVGMYSAGKDRYETGKAIILGGIQSIYNKTESFGNRDLVFVDEAHRINPRSESTQYGQMFQGFPSARIIGLTATPYRLGSGWICDSDAWLNEISYEVSVTELIAGGFLCPLRSKWLNGIDSQALSVSSTGDFAEGEMQDAFMAKLSQIVQDMYSRCKDRRSVIVFAAGVNQAYSVQKILYDFFGDACCEVVTGETSEADRKDIFDDFRFGGLKYLVNCNCLTEGFDARNVDCVVLQRATISPGLYYQMAGRGLRTHETKRDCLVLDYGENIARHGPIDAIDPGRRKRGKTKALEAPVKQCPNCMEAIAIQCKICPHCDYIFQTEPAIKISDKPSSESILSDGEEKDDLEFVPVKRIDVSLHSKQGSFGDGPRSIKITYYGYSTMAPLISQWINCEHEGFARIKAEQWWMKFKTGKPCPANAEDGVEILNQHFQLNPLAIPSAVKFGPQKKDPKWDEVKSISFAKKYRAFVGNPFAEAEVQIDL